MKNFLSIQEMLASLPQPIIFQGPMGVGVFRAPAIATVFQEGGFPMISAAGLGFRERGKRKFFDVNIEATIREIRETRELIPDGFFGINLMYALNNFAELAKAAIDEHVSIISVSAGTSRDIAKLVKGTATKYMVTVSSAKSAQTACNIGMHTDNLPDVVGVEGPEAGGHLGYDELQLNDPNVKLKIILAEVIRVVQAYAHIKKIPVIAGGGVYYGGEAKELLDLGAAGIQIAERLIATKECSAAHAFKQMHINANVEDIVIIDSPVRMKGRAILNKFLKDVAKGERKPKECPGWCLKTCDVVNSPYCIVEHLTAAVEGDVDNGLFFCGAKAYLTKEISTIPKVMSSFREEYWQKCA